MKVFSEKLLFDTKEKSGQIYIFKKKPISMSTKLSDKQITVPTFIFLLYYDVRIMIKRNSQP